MSASPFGLDPTKVFAYEMKIVEGPDDMEPDPIDLDSPEDVLFAVDAAPYKRQPPWADFCVADTQVIYGTPGITGAAQYDVEYGGFLDYTIESLIHPPGEGYFVLEGVTGLYHKGDGWTTDDDMDFYYEGVRPATPEELCQLWVGCPGFWCSEPENEA